MLDPAYESFPYLSGFEPIPDSLVRTGSGTLYMARHNRIRYLVTQGPLAGRFAGENTGDARICPLSPENSRMLQELLPEYKPVPLNRNGPSLGCGDRLGAATSGQLKAVAKTGIQPVIAQQSVLELRLSGRTCEEVLNDAVWGAFQAGYRGPFTADGDHLKNGRDIERALAAGYTMVTLDCSDKLHPKAFTLTPDEKLQLFREMPAHVTRPFLARYLESPLPVVPATEAELAECVLVYQDAIEFADYIYNRHLAGRPGISLEISVDETVWPTSPFAHYFLANELATLRHVCFDSLAPRFVGDFQRAIDYIGDVGRFERHLAEHHRIASLWGHKVSIHTGSDKFRIYPAIARITGHRYHIKTSGTSWLEFFRLVADHEPDLFWELYQFSLAHLDEAKRLYHISTTRQICPDIHSASCESIDALLSNENVRQLLHVNYGNILNHLQDGSPLYKNRLYRLLRQEESRYQQVIQTHFENHLRALGEFSDPMALAEEPGPENAALLAENPQLEMVTTG